MPPSVQLFSGVVPTFILPIESSYCLCHPLSIYLVVWFYPYPTHWIILLSVSPSVHLLNGVVTTLILAIESSHWLCHPLSIYLVVWFLPLSYPLNHLTVCVTLCPFIEWCGYYPYPSHRIISLAVSPSVHLFSGVVPTLILPIESSYCLCHPLPIYWMVWFLPLSYPSNHLTGCVTLCPFIEWCSSYPYPSHRIILLAVSPSAHLFSSVVPTLILPIESSYWLFHPLVHLFSGMVPTLVLPLSYPSPYPTVCVTLCPSI